MPTYSLRAPNGKTYEIEGPKGASEAQVRAEILRRDPSAGRANTPADMAKGLAAGALQGVSQMADAAGQVGRAMLAGPLKAGLALAGATTGRDTRGAIQAIEGASASSPVGRLERDRQASALNYQPATTAGRYAKTVGTMLPNAIAPGGMARRAAAVVLPGVASEGAGQAVEALGGGQLAQGAARLGGAVAGGLGASLRLNPQGRNPVPNLPRQNPAQMQQRAQEYRSAGINPALIDVVDDSGRGAVRAAASRMTPARQQTTEFADARALDLPSRMGGQARRVLSQDPRTPDQIRGAMTAQRGTNADRNFGAVRGQEVTMQDQTVLALRTDAARDAIREAARRERDPETRRRLMGLANEALDAPSTPITVGMADRVSRVLLGRAQAAARSGDNDLASTLGNLGRDIRTPVAEAVPGYRAALDDYGADTRLTQAAGVGEDLLTRNTDEFAQLAQGLTPEERQLALAAARRAIERKAGESTGSAPGVARQIANAPEQQVRTAALAGPEGAQRLQQGMRLEERLVRNAGDVAPRTGSQTQNKAQDAADMMSGAVRVGGQIGRGDWLGAGIDWLRSRGMNDAQAERLVNMALDPAQVDHVMRLITARYGPQQAQRFRALRQTALVPALSGMSAAPSPSDQTEPPPLP